MEMIVGERQNDDFVDWYLEVVQILKTTAYKIFEITVANGIGKEVILEYIINSP